MASRRLGAAPVEVSIDADRCLDGLAAQVRLDDRQRDAGDDHPGGTGVSEVVNVRRLRQPSGDGLAAGGFPAAVEELPPAIGENEQRIKTPVQTFVETAAA
jgi:hypothetical protein